ncbi:MAG: hypothetical protein KKG33_08300 [candidate division Zixibacteria bacterium]|nr:hypothetical protein [candidate division Zixibacteria bacterium]
MDLSRLDRRIIYLLLLAAVAIPLTLKVNLPVSVGPETQKVYDAIDALPQGSRIMISFDIEASSLPEIQPVAIAIIKHAFSKDLHIIGLALFSEGTAIGYNLLSSIARSYDKEYGDDFIYLGYRPQYVSAILGMGENIRNVFPLDYRNENWLDFPAFSDLSDYDDIPLVVSLADGSLPTYWVEYAGARYGQKVATGLTAVMATSYYPYTASGQLEGLVGGLKGASEYEKLLGYSGGGQRGMLAQSSGHLMIVLLVIIANLAAWRRKL